jgi:hypothetical protein
MRVDHVSRQQVDNARTAHPRACSCRRSSSARRSTGRSSPTTIGWHGITCSKRRPTGSTPRCATACSCRCSARTTARCKTKELGDAGLWTVTWRALAELAADPDQGPDRRSGTRIARHDPTIKARQTYSDRLVACQTAPGKVEGKTLFWLEPLSPDGVVDEAETGVPDDQGPLALPEGEPPA